jgi:hypothetical protein
MSAFGIVHLSNSYSIARKCPLRNARWSDTQFTDWSELESHLMLGLALKFQLLQSEPAGADSVCIWGEANLEGHLASCSFFKSLFWHLDLGCAYV